METLGERTGQFSYQVLDKDFVDLDHERGGLQANPGAEDLDEAWNRKTGFHGSSHRRDIQSSCSRF